MARVWIPLMTALLAVATAANGGVQTMKTDCVEVQTSSQLVPLGSEFTASCVVRLDCPLLGKRVTNIELSVGSRLLARSIIPVTDGNSSVTYGNSLVTDGNIRNVTALVANFNESSAFVSCCVHTSPCLVVGGAEVRAGFAPLAPGRVHCQTKLTVTSTMTCSWEPSPRDPLLPTNYTLHTRLSESGGGGSYPSPAGVWRVVLTRSEFVLFEEMTVWVTASNALGQAASEPITVEPLRSVKFEPPQVEQVEARRGGCLQVKWSLIKENIFMNGKMSLEARVRASETPTWTLVTVRKKPEVCDLLHGTQYQVQIRACYQGSPWSEWSHPKTGLTLEKAPVGRLDYWIKFPEAKKGKLPAYQDVRLFWKPSRGFRSNGRVTSYRVSEEVGGQRLCSTPGFSCSLRLRRRQRKVFLWAQNSAGSSPPTQVLLLPFKALTAISNITVTSQGERSLLVKWKNCTRLTGSGVIDYVVEWRPMLNTNSSPPHFELANRNQSSLLLTGAFEPYQPYEVSVYPRFKDAIGRPETAMAYSRQKAPSSAPELKVSSVWPPSVELSWEELPLQERNGILSSYQLFYWEDPQHIHVVRCGSDNQRVLLEGLSKVTSYSFLLEVSTQGGNRNGSVITFRTLAADASDVGVVVALSLIGLSLATFIAFTAWLRYQKWVQLRLCPRIPDPAHSSVKSWSFDTLQELWWVWDKDEPPVVHLSHLSLLDVSVKSIQQWGVLEDTSDLGDSLCSSPLTPTFPQTPCGSVSYATVLCTCPYTGQLANQAPAYLRSESTQPLLENYQNMASHDVIAREPFFFGRSGGPDEGAESDTEWEEFPMLRALALGDAPE